MFSHRQLWRAAGRIREHAASLENNKLAYEMTALLLASLTVEAYCNFSIEVIDPEVFKSERRVFGGRIGNKIEWLANRASYRIEKGLRPFQTVGRLKYLRDRIVHAKPETYFKELFNPSTEENFMHPGELESMVHSIPMDQAFEDVRRFCEAMHKALRKAASSTQKRQLQPKALFGPIQRETFNAAILSRLPRSVQKQQQQGFDF